MKRKTGVVLAASLAVILAAAGLPNLTASSDGGQLILLEQDGCE